MHIRSIIASLGSLFMASAVLSQQNPEGLAKPGTAKVIDVFQPLAPRADKLGGLLGDRYSRSESSRLLKVNEEELLAGFRKKPGKQAWIGEHVGKWLHAASLAYAGTGDPALREKLDRVAAALIATQGPDGYLGTYVPEKRFGLYPDADWDVWVHKYDLLGLLTYYQYTGNKAALGACRRVGDLLANTFGPGKKSILSAGTHMGMASTSVLEPMVLLYRATADPRYLAFAKYIVWAWDEPGGPRIISTLMKEKSVRKTANAKAYEMLSNLNGLCELYRATHDLTYIEPVLIAWGDIVEHRLYITGTGSSHEHWQDEFHLPNGPGADLGETCVTVSWEQLNLQLLRLFGKAQFADQIERSVYNHLLGAQKPTADAWCYYTPLSGTKPYGSETNCCLSSGPRGVALLPTLAVMAAKDGPVVNLFTNASATVPLAKGTVEVVQNTDFPLMDSSRVTLMINPRAGASEFTVRIRKPQWCVGIGVSVNDKPFFTKDFERVGVGSDGFLPLHRTWTAGDRISVSFTIPIVVVLGDHENDGRAAVMSGPLVLAADSEHNPNVPALNRLAFKADSVASLKLRRVNNASIAGEPVWETEGVIRSGGETKTVPLRLVPFYAAGQKGGRYEVWIHRASSAPAIGTSLFSQADEKRSRNGNQPGSIVDDDPGTYVVTFDGTKHDEDWYEVSLGAPVEINRVVFAHGHCFHDGGWFDTSVGKPTVLVRKEPNGPWEKIAELDGYPAAMATYTAGLTDGQMFTARFPAVKVAAVRVTGKPACGDNDKQAFSSCGELQACLDK